MNLVNMISSLHTEKKAILKMAIDRKHLSAFLKYLEEFKGDFFKVKLTMVISPAFFEFDETEGKRVYLKIKTLKAIQETLAHHPYHLRELKDFVDYNGTLDMTEGDMKQLKKIGIHTEIV